MAEDIERTLGRIEQKVDSLKEAMAEQFCRVDSILFDRGTGLEPRIRGLETDVVTIKTKASIAALIVSSVVTGLFAIAGWVLKK